MGIIILQNFQPTFFSVIEFFLDPFALLIFSGGRVQRGCGFTELYGIIIGGRNNFLTEEFVGSRFSLRILWLKVKTDSNLSKKKKENYWQTHKIE